MKTQRVIPVITFPTNAYLLVGERIVAIDVAAPSVARAMIKTVTGELGRPASDIAWITATHYHVDHVGGIAELVQACGAKVLLSEAVRGHFQRGERLAFPPPRRWINMFVQRAEVAITNPGVKDLATMSRIGMPLGLNEKPRFLVDGWLVDGMELPGGSGFRVIAAPGHSPCSVAFYNKSLGALLSGDTILGGLARPMINSFVIDRDQVLSSAMKLAKLDVRALYPGHGKFYFGAGVLDGISGSLPPDGLTALPWHLKRRAPERG
jgi:glyoxylase-like metal-dependent hydrolase (beta-lactamase superfamily II)